MGKSNGCWSEVMIAQNNIYLVCNHKMVLSASSTIEGDGKFSNTFVCFPACYSYNQMREPL